MLTPRFTGTVPCPPRALLALRGGIRLLAGLAALGVFSAAGFAQTEGRRALETPVKIEAMKHLHVTSRGRIIDDAIAPSSGYGQRDCNNTATLTDASFTGGSYRMEAGMGQGEMFAATYTLPASAFPIKIVSAEQIFATQNATTATTTQWSVLFFSGPPNTGSLVATFSSDDIVLPSIQMGPGTNGTDVQFSIDPTDPDQLYINDNGTHKFSVAFRIDHHNQQTADPCTTAPPTCCNAFMCVDNSGLSQGAANWLYGLNCGAFGCPANGGWASFSALNQFCRPTGDIVSRTIWQSVSCTPGVGACCLPNGACEVRTITDCNAGSGSYQGDNVTCEASHCPAPTGACCFGNGFCTVLSQSDCTGAGGTFLGAGSVCGAGNSCPTGACCLPTGACITGVTSQNCVGQGGTFRGVGTNCSSPCPQPNGACCTPNGFCLSTTNAACTGIGGVWKGALTTCVDGNGNGHADICEPPCGTADFNGDGDVGTDADIEAYFACLAGNCCPGCGSADFNHDGDIGTDADIEAFFRVLAGGSC